MAADGLSAHASLSALHGAAMVNAMTVDVEDYFQVQALAGQVGRGEWETRPCRVEGNVDALLALFQEHGVRATFFTLGWIAERYPALIRRIVAGGHELASHGYEHARADSQTPEVFRADIRRTRRLLEDIGQVPIRGYRAASFSIGARNLWAFDVLAEEGYTYSSSIYPIRHDLYGMPEAPRFAFRPRPRQDIVELPVTTNQVLGARLPCGGGGYFRLLPYALSRWQMRRVNRVDGQPCIFYFHPWEIDPEQPRVAGLGWKSRFRHYTNLGRMRGRLARLAGDFAWDRMDRVFARERLSLAA